MMEGGIIFFEEGFSNLVEAKEVRAYDLSQMELNENGIMTGEFRRRIVTIPSFRDNLSHVMNLALNLYDKHAFLIGEGFRADLYDIGPQGVFDVDWEEGGLYCPLTNTQLRNFQSRDCLETHLWSVTASSGPNGPIIEVGLNDADKKWLRDMWDLGENEEGLGDFMRRSLKSLDEEIGRGMNGYASVYVRAGENPRTLFEFNGGVN